MRQVEEKDRIVVNATYELFVFLLVLLSIANSALVFLLNSEEARHVALFVDVGISLFLMADAMVQLIRAPRKRSYLIDYRGWMVLVGSLPVPGVRVLRLLRTILLARQLRRSDYALMGRIVVEKHHAHPVLLAQRNACLGSNPTQKGVRLAHQQPAAIAGFTIGGHCAPVGQAGQRGNGGVDQPVAGLVIHLRDQAKTATVSLEFRPVQALRLGRREKCGHRMTPPWVKLSREG